MTALYIHWPFCKSKCPYCDFNSHVAEHIDYQEWHDAYRSELIYYANQLHHPHINTIFFGGGTPSLMPPSLVKNVLETVNQHYSLAKDAEITLECNPTSVETANLKAFAKAGVNRISMGIQSFDNQNLKFLGRTHDKDEALKAIEVVQNHYSRYSLDFIYALPSQTVEAWQDELKQALSLANGHLSLYQLTLEKGTPFYSDYLKGALKPLEEDLATDLYFATEELMAKHGYDAYEISNYAQKSQECQHNLTYWHYGDYIGIGPGAHGRLRFPGEGNHKHAIMNHHNPKKWLSWVNAHNHGQQDNRKLASKDMTEEAIMMGLRLRGGIDLQRFQQETGVIFAENVDRKEHEALLASGYIAINDSHCWIPQQHRPVTNGIVKKLLSTNH